MKTKENSQSKSLKSIIYINDDESFMAASNSSKDQLNMRPRKFKILKKLFLENWRKKLVLQTKVSLDIHSAPETIARLFIIFFIFEIWMNDNISFLFFFCFCNFVQSTMTTKQAVAAAIAIDCLEFTSHSFVDVHRLFVSLRLWWAS